MPPPPTDAVWERGGQIHVWCAHLDVEPSEYRRLTAMLSEDEQARAARFRFETDRKRWSVARALLRTTLAQYSGQDPRHLRFTENGWGKRLLEAEPGGASSLHFNVSHSREVALFAIARDREVGIDIEYIRSDSSLEDIHDWILSPEEQEALAAVPEEEKDRVCLRYWVAKEAHLKAIGIGLSRPPDTVPIPTRFTQGSAAVGRGAEDLFLQSFGVNPAEPNPIDDPSTAAYVAALAAIGDPEEVRFFVVRY